jgi:hypothetical protein
MLSFLHLAGDAGCMPGRRAGNAVRERERERKNEREGERKEE